MSRRGQRILPQYSSMEHQSWWPWMRLGLFVTLVLMSAYAGLLLTVGGARAVSLVAVPIMVVSGLVLWMLPDVNREFRLPYFGLLLVYCAGSAMWPNYLAIVLPGLPWVTPPRLILALMLVIMTVHLSQHAASRQAIGDIILHDKIAARLYLMFWLVAIAVLPLAPSFAASLNYTIMQELFVFAPVLLVALLLHKKIENLRPIVLAVVVGCIFTMLVAILENFMQQPPWINFIPSFINIDAESLQTYLSPQARAGQRSYRVRATFGIVLYYTEYLAIVFPVLFHFMLKFHGRKRFLFVPLLILMFAVVWYANARTAVIGLFLTLFGTATLAIIKQVFFKTGGDRLKALISVTFIAMAVLASIGAVASSHRLQMYTIGGSQHAGSNDGRDLQWANTWRHLSKNPVGVGLGNSMRYVGVEFRAGVPIVDSFYINLLVDVGVLGFFGFMGCIARISWLGIQTHLRSGDELEDMAGPLALGLLAFMIISYVVSTTDNNYIVFIFATCILALHRRQEQRLALQPAVHTSLPSSSTQLAKI